MLKERSNAPVITYIAAFDLLSPLNTSSRQRILGISSALHEAGFQVNWLVESPKGDQKIRDSLPDWLHVEELLQVPAKGRFGRRLQYMRQGITIAAHLRGAPHKPDLVVVYDASPFFTFNILGRLRRVQPMAFDLIDWPDSFHFPEMRHKPLQLLTNVAMHAAARWSRGCLVISSHLGARLAKIQPELLVVPPLQTDFNATPSPWREDTALELVYAGNIGLKGRKDGTTLMNLLVLARSVDAGARNMRIRIVGVTESQASSLGLLRGPSAPGVTVEFLGPLRPEDTRTIVGEAHFTVLQRSPEHSFAQAGFPTKVTESLSQGTPVLGNITSDLGNYLVDGVNAIVLEDDRPGSLTTAVQRILDGDAPAFDRARIVEQAADAFSPRAHSKRISSFLSTCMSGESSQDKKVRRLHDEH